MRPDVRPLLSRLLRFRLLPSGRLRIGGSWMRKEWQVVACCVAARVNERWRRGMF